MNKKFLKFISIYLITIYIILFCPTDHYGQIIVNDSKQPLTEFATCVGESLNLQTKTNTNARYTWEINEGSGWVRISTASNILFELKLIQGVQFRVSIITPDTSIVNLLSLQVLNCGIHPTNGSYLSRIPIFYDDFGTLVDMTGTKFKVWDYSNPSNPQQKIVPADAPFRLKIDPAPEGTTFDAIDAINDFSYAAVANMNYRLLSWASNINGKSKFPEIGYDHSGSVDGAALLINLPDFNQIYKRTLTNICVENGNTMFFECFITVFTYETDGVDITATLDGGGIPVTARNVANKEGTAPNDGIWVAIRAQVEITSAKTLSIQIKNNSPLSRNGNDLAIDDIKLMAGVPPKLDLFLDTISLAKTDTVCKSFKLSSLPNQNFKKFYGNNPSYIFQWTYSPLDYTSWKNISEPSTTTSWSVNDLASITGAVPTNGQKVYFRTVSGNRSSLIPPHLIFNESDACRNYSVSNVVEAIYNCNIASPKLEADLVVSNGLVTPAAIIPGENFSISCSIGNVGDTTLSPDAYLQYFFSKDSLYQSNDIRLSDSITIGKLNKDITLEIQKKNYLLPNTTLAGKYFILLAADITSKSNDNIKNNNIQAIPITVTSLPELRIVEFSSSSKKLAAGTTSILTSKIQNTGGVSIPKCKVNYFLSTNDTYEKSDLALTDSMETGTILKDSGIFASQANILLPKKLASGNYYILCMVDLNDQVKEHLETNNMASFPITFYSLSDVFTFNLKCTPSTVIPGNEVTITSDVNNFGGTTTSHPVSQSYYFSTDNIYDSNDVALGNKIILNVLETGTTSTVTPMKIIIPANTIAGNYYIISVVDIENKIEEYLEENNIASILINVGTTSDIATVNSLVTPRTLLIGGNINIGCTVTNSGGIGIKEPINVEYFLSLDDIYDAQDKLIGTGGTITSLIPKDSVSISEKTFIISKDIVAGKYFIILAADANNTNKEAKHKNNFLAEPVTITSLPDYKISQLIVNPLEPFQNDSISLSSAIINISTGNATMNSLMHYYFSTDSIFDPKDVLLGIPIPLLAIDGMDTYNSTKIKVKLPEIAEEGVFTVFLVVDPLNNIAELNKQNNIAKVSLTIIPLPDFITTINPFTTTTIFQENSISISGSVKNIGKGNTTDSIEVNYYLSKDQNLDVSDILIGKQFKIPGLAENELSNNIKQTYTIPATTNSGTYYVLMNADRNSKIKELVEVNNSSNSKITIGNPSLTDLTLLELFINPSTTISGESIGIEHYIKNIGKESSGAAYKIKYYLSKDLLLDEVDSLVGVYNSNFAIGADSIDKIPSKKYKIPASILPGNYNILFYVDPENKINESNEDNNIASLPIRVLPLPDLHILNAAITLPTLFTGETTSVSATVRNDGGSQTHLPAKFIYFLSEDGVLDNNDKILHNAQMKDKLIATESQNLVSNIQIPTYVKAGNYYILLTVNDDYKIAESDHTNNSKIIPISIKPRPSIVNKNSQVNIEIGKPTKFEIHINSDVPLSNVTLNYRKITDSTLTVNQKLIPGLNNDFHFTIPTSFTDEIGIEYSVMARDSNGNENAPFKGTVYVSHLKPGLVIPYNSFGAKVANYRIISIPLILKSINSDSLFYPVLGNKNIQRWRSFSFNGISNIEMAQNSQVMEPGRGYWLIIKNQPGKPLTTGPGKTVAATIAEPFSIPLSKGWNLIGNPYTFDITWQDIIGYKKNLSKPFKRFKTFNGTYNENDTLHTMEGAFIFATEDTKLYFPTQKGNNGKTFREGKNISNNTTSHWYIPLTVEGSNMNHTLSGIGMDEAANLSYDAFDDFTPPKLDDWMEINFEHPEYFYSKFTKDIVPSCDQHTWEFNVTSSTAGKKELKWNKLSIENFSKKIILYDTELEKIIDMDTQLSYVFNSGLEKKFKIYYGSEDFIKNSLFPQMLTLGNPVPNPFNNESEISFSLPETLLQYTIDLSIYNSEGAKIKQIENGFFDPGFYTSSWDGSDFNAHMAPGGLYIFKLTVNHTNFQKVITSKVVLR